MDFFLLDGLKIQPGDLICTSDGDDSPIRGQFWRLIGKLIPGEVDHIVIYVGPGGRCVEAGAKGRVITFECPGNSWDARAMLSQRGMLDQLVGAAYPVRALGLTPDQERRLRRNVVDYCLRQAEKRKPYNINFINSGTEDAFYCSQLAYQAYLKNGVNLNTGRSLMDIPQTEKIIFPQEIWDGRPHARKP